VKKEYGECKPQKDKWVSINLPRIKKDGACSKAEGKRGCKNFEKSKN